MLAFKMMSIVKSALLGACLALVFLIHPAAAPVMSEVVYFASGRVMLIAEHRIDRQNVVLSLKGGGKVFFDADLIDRIEPSVVYGPPPVRADIRTLQRQPLPSKPYAALIQRAAERHDVTANLLHALIEVESGYQPDAESLRGAKGLMQLMPATARDTEFTIPSIRAPTSMPEPSISASCSIDLACAAVSPLTMQGRARFVNSRAFRPIRKPAVMSTAFSGCSRPLRGSSQTPQSARWRFTT